MGKKKKGQKVSNKKLNAMKDKIVADKTFGMKNKKGSKNQKYIAQVKSQVHNRGKDQRQVRDEASKKYVSKKEQAAKRKADLLLTNLFAVSAKDKEKKKMLKEKAERQRMAGLNGGKKKKSRKKKKGQKNAPPPKPKDTRPMEVQIEEKRKALWDSGKKLTPVNLETFTAWKKKTDAIKAKLRAKKLKEYEKETGRRLAKTGKQLYMEQASLFKDDDAGDATRYEVKDLLVDEAEEEGAAEESKADPEADAAALAALGAAAPPVPPAAAGAAAAGAASAAAPPAPPAAAVGAIDASLYLDEDLDDLDDLDDDDDDDA